MIKFKAKDVKKRGNVLTLDARNEYQGQFVVIIGNKDGEGQAKKMQAYCLHASDKQGPHILEQTRGAIPVFNVLVTINRALTKWHNSGGGRITKADAESLTRSRLKAMMRYAKLLEIDDLVADRTEFEAHFG